MPAFLEDITPFIGTGQENEDHQTLAEFLEMYDPYKYKNPSVTTDILVLEMPEELTQVETGLRLLMVKRRNHPSIGYWALPGGFVNVEEDMEVAAKRELEEETGLSGIPIESVATYGEANRDPRSRIITTAYVALVKGLAGREQAGDDAADACFVNVTLKKQGERKETIEGKDKVITTYQLFLSNEEKELHMEASVDQICNSEGILKEQKFRVVSNQGIAFDHPRFIVETLLYVKRVAGL